MTPVITPPLPGEPVQVDDDIPGYDQSGPQVITGLREYDGAVEWELRRDVRRFHGGGSKDCEIWIPALSATHFSLERRGRSLRLYDMHSRHGTWILDTPITTADLRPGSKFTAKPVTLVAMNDAMRRHRPMLVEILGARWVISPDWLMIEAASSGHMLITGDPGCGQEELARAVHAMSPREGREPIEPEDIPEQRAAQMDIIKQASKHATTVATTVVLKLRPKPSRIGETFLSLLFSSAYGVRVIVLAQSQDDARSAIGEPIVSLCQHVLLRPLSLRNDEIDQLLDRMFVERKAPHLRAGDLLAENLDALRRHAWPENLAELRRVAHIIAAHETQGGWRGASESLGKAKTTLQDYFDRIGLKTIKVERADRLGKQTIQHTFFKPRPDRPGER